MGETGNLTMTAVESASCLSAEGTTREEGVSEDLLPIVYGGLHNVYLASVAPLLGDRRWTKAVASAVEAAVLDQRARGAGAARVCVLGLGTGAAACAAARVGAEVVWVETLKRYANVASAVARRNGLRVDARHYASKGATLASWKGDGDPFDVVVTESGVATDLLGNELLVLARAARSALLRRPHGRFLPGRARVYAVALELRTGDVSGFDLSEFDAFRNGDGNRPALRYADKFAGHRALSAPVKVFELDFNDPASLVTAAEAERIAEVMRRENPSETCTVVGVRRTTLRAARAGVFNAVGVYFDLEYAPGAWLSFGPAAARKDGPLAFHDVVHYVGYERRVAKGDAVEVAVHVDEAADRFVVAAPPGPGATFLRQKPVLQYHFHMINDATRNDAYEAAIVRALAGRGGALVLDVGAGTGLLSMMAARAGARAVACEMVPELAAAATRIVAANG